MRLLALALLLFVLAGCVQIPEEELLPDNDAAPEPSTAVPMIEEQPPEQLPAENATVPAPNGTPATQASPQQATQQPNATQQSSQQAWTTQPISISEGETKTVYVKKSSGY